MTVIPITPAASRRNALRLALGGAAVVALPAAASPVTLQVSDPDKRLRWLGEQLELEYALYWRSAEALAAYTASVPHLKLVRYHGEPNSPEWERKNALWLAREGRWARVEARCWEIAKAEVRTLPGLAVKARAVEIAAAGIATARCAISGKPLTEQQIGYWAPGRMLAFIRDLRNVAGVMA